MKTIRIKLTDGNEGEVSLDIARSMIANGHAVAVGEVVNHGGGETAYATLPFDPSAHTVDEVLAQLEAVVDDPSEVARIQQAERDGKARRGLVQLWDGQGTDEASGTA